MTSQTKGLNGKLESFANRIPKPFWKAGSIFLLVLMCGAWSFGLLQIEELASGCLIGHSLLLNIKPDCSNQHFMTNSYITIIGAFMYGYMMLWPGNACLKRSKA